MAAQLRPKNLIPLAHVEHGWVFGNSISVFGPDVAGEVVQLPLDELDRYFTPPFAIAIAPDKSAAYISTTGSDSVTVIDIPKMLKFVRAATPAQRRTLANDLSASANYVDHPHPRRIGAQRPRALSRWKAPLRREPHGRHHLRHRHRVAQSQRHAFARRACQPDPRAPRRASLLQRPLRLPEPLRLRQLPPRIHLRRPAVGPRAGRLRQGHRG